MPSVTVQIAGRIIQLEILYEQTRTYIRDYEIAEDSVEDNRMESAIALKAPSLQELQRLQKILWEEQKVSHSEAWRYEVDWLFNRINALLRERGVFSLHGSAVLLDGSCYIFTAPSGTGKSTHARLWKAYFGDRVQILNDDKPYVERTAEGAYTVYGAPWCGKHRIGINSRAPLQAICVLRRGKENRIRRLRPGEALPLLLQQIFIGEGPDGLQQIFGFAEQLCKEIPVYMLYCDISEDAVRVSAGAMAADR